ncbi:MAG: hypothetical protein ACOVQ0_08830 [Novosphingobium sp.]|uniref:hypothetical protein n=1 Tax=Novosphingobium sp. TaxID=1874826 RepID=UPI003B9CFC31
MEDKKGGDGTRTLPIINGRFVEENTPPTFITRQFIKHMLTYDTNNRPIRKPAELVLRRRCRQFGGGNLPVETTSIETLVLRPDEEKELAVKRYDAPPPFLRETNDYERVSLRYLD